MLAMWTGEADMADIVDDKGRFILPLEADEYVWFLDLFQAMAETPDWPGSVSARAILDKLKPFDDPGDSSPGVRLPMRPRFGRKPH